MILLRFHICAVNHECPRTVRTHERTRIQRISHYLFVVVLFSLYLPCFCFHCLYLFFSELITNISANTFQPFFLKSNTNFDSDSKPQTEHSGNGNEKKNDIINENYLQHILCKFMVFDEHFIGFKHFASFVVHNENERGKNPFRNNNNNTS